MRIYLIVLLSLVLIPLLLATTTLAMANIVLTESFVTATLEKANLFGVIEDTLPEFFEDSFEEEMEEGEGEEGNPFAVIMPRLEFGGIVEELGGSLIGKVFAYLSGAADTVEFTLDFSPIAQQIEAMILDKEIFVEVMMEVEPDRAHELERISDEELAEIQQEVLAGFREDVEGGDFPGEMHVDFVEMLKEDDPNAVDFLDNIRLAYSYMRTALFVALGVCLLIVLLMLLLSRPGGMTAAGICMLLVGGPLAAGAVTARLSMSRIVAMIPDDAPGAIQEVAEGLLGHFLSVPRNIGLGLSLGAIVLFALAVVVTRAKKRKLAAQQPAEPESIESDAIASSEPAADESGRAAEDEAEEDKPETV